VPRMKDLGKRRALYAILFADIQGFTAIMQSDETKAIAYLHHYHESLRAEVSSHHGEIVKNFGDGSLCLFSSVLQAVLCAQGLQLRLQEDPKVPLRIGIHLGDVMHADNDVYGDAINIASRIESLGVPGSVLLSKSVFDKVKNQRVLPMKSLGDFNFKNVEKPMEVFALSSEGLTVPRRSELSGKLAKSQSSFSYKNIILSILAIALVGFGIYKISKSFLGSDNQSDAVLAHAEKSRAEENSIAVLAFTDMSPAQDQQYFSEGISEEILNLLTKIPNLKVISRTSSFALKGKNSTITEMGQILNVSHILDGSIRKSQDAFRISTQLIEAKSGVQIWSETYNRPLDDIFSIQDDIATRIIEEFKVSLMGRVISSQTVNVDAYNLYLEAKSLKDERTAESDEKAEELIRDAIKIDSTYAPSWAMLSELIFNGAFSYSRYPISEAISRSRSTAEKAIHLDPNNSLGYIALTTLNRAENDFVVADKNLKKALEIDPENTDVIYECASYALDIGNMDEAIIHLRKAIELDPINYLLYYTLGLHLMWIEDYDGAEIEMAKYLEKNPDSGLANNFMAQIYLKQGRVEEAKEALSKDEDPYWSLYRKSILYYAVGDKRAADNHLNEFIEEFGDEGWPNIAHVYAYRGEQD